ncbi:hypothetical protein AbraCBS73388_005386 [Aspergillus brasiliensis]|uniref:Uncharacterized protein n=1 Tax=Aspergillus brasiliensis TaxID=319629 RepID=A0A9W5YMI8_9EURO|nr:hypothetical protein AbraCBS73388_005386 [Aspergillus brasiliensis]
MQQRNPRKAEEQRDASPQQRDPYHMTQSHVLRVMSQRGQAKPKAGQVRVVAAGKPRGAAGPRPKWKADLKPAVPELLHFPLA